MQYFKPVSVTITASRLVEYRYEVGGATFESSQVWPSNNERNITEAAATLMRVRPRSNRWQSGVWIWGWKRLCADRGRQAKPE